MPADLQESSEITDKSISATVYRMCEQPAVCEDPVAVYCVSDNDDFTNLYQELYPFAYFTARKYVGAEDAYDVVAMVFGKLWAQKKTLERIGQIRPYVRTAIRNACIDHIRSLNIRNKEYRSYSDLLGAAEAEGHGFDEISAEKLTKIYTEIEKLPARCREIFKLTYIDDLKNAEIAAMLGISVNTVKNQKTTALKILRLSLLSALSGMLVSLSHYC